MTHSHPLNDDGRPRRVGGAQAAGRVARTRRRAAPLTALIRQEQIIDRALELVDLGGFNNLTMKKIASRMGVSEAAIYRHMPTRRALVAGLMDRLEAMLLVPIKTIAADAMRTRPERLEAVLRHHVAVVLKHHSLPILLLAEASASGDAKLLGRMRGIFGSYVDVLRTLLEPVMGESARHDPAALALLFLGVPSALAIRHRLEPDIAAGHAAADVLIPLIVDCLTSPKRHSA